MRDFKARELFRAETGSYLRLHCQIEHTAIPPEIKARIGPKRLNIVWGHWQLSSFRIRQNAATCFEASTMRNRLSLIATVLAVAVAGVGIKCPGSAETSIEISLKTDTSRCWMTER